MLYSIFQRLIFSAFVPPTTKKSLGLTTQSPLFCSLLLVALPARIPQRGVHFRPEVMLQLKQAFSVSIKIHNKVIIAVFSSKHVSWREIISATFLPQTCRERRQLRPLSLGSTSRASHTVLVRLHRLPSVPLRGTMAEVSSSGFSEA